jgi:hypothetical protein
VSNGITYFRAWRDLKNGGTIALPLRFGISKQGELLLPAKNLSFTDDEVRELIAVDPNAPVFRDGDKFFMEAKYAARFCEDPVPFSAFEFLRSYLLSNHTP